VSGIPKDIPDFGSAEQRARQNPEFDPTKQTSFTSEDYYVWSRIDGTASLRELILMIGFETDKTVGILTRLREFGALLLPDETPASVKERAAKAAQPVAQPAAGEPKVKLRPSAGDADDRRTSPSSSTKIRARRATPPPGSAGEGSGSTPVVDDLDDATLNDVERGALAEDNVLSATQRRRVLSMLRKLRTVDYFTLFGLTETTSKREIKRAYFRMSKEFHPDRFYGKALGSFAPWLSAVFEHLTTAFEALSNQKKRDAYVAALHGETPASRREKGEQSREEYAQELFSRACSSETSGDLANAVQFFAAVVRMDPKPKYLRRAARCAVSAGELSTAEEYAKKAADLQRQDPSYLRVLADVYRASGNWGEAEKILVGALELKTENDVLTGELQADLADVRSKQSP